MSRPSSEAKMHDQDYMQAMQAGNKFCQLVDEAMDNFRRTYGSPILERPLKETNEKGAINEPSSYPNEELARDCGAPKKDGQSGSSLTCYEELTEEDFIRSGHLLETRDGGIMAVAIILVINGLLVTGERILVMKGISVPDSIDTADTIGASSEKESVAIPDETVAKRKKKKKKKKAKSQGSERDQLTGPPKPRNFLEAALYFSTVTLGTVSMANQLNPDVFFAPPLLFLTQPHEFEEIFSTRRLRSGPEFEGNKYLQRRISALFAVALVQSCPAVRPYALFSQHDKMASKGSSSRTNFLKRSIGFFAVSLVDHLPPAMSNRLLQSHDGGLDAAMPAHQSLGLDDLRVPSPEHLAEFWLGLSMEERLRLVQEESLALVKGWINPKKTWCMCKYCKHRRLRLSDIFDHAYRAYYEELVAFELRMKGVDVPAMTPHQAKVRRLLYKALSVVAEDILNTKSRLMLEAISRLGRVFTVVDLSGDEDDGGGVEGIRGRRLRGKATTAQCDCDTCHLNEDCWDEHEAGLGDGSDLDDLDIEEDGDFYEDYNYGEDDEYIHMEGEVAIDEAQLPSCLPSFYDLEALGETLARVVDHGAEGELLFQSFISQVFQFHLVPAYLAHEAVKKQQQQAIEEAEAERLAEERKALRAEAKQRKRERQKAAKASSAKEAAAAAAAAVEKIALVEIQSPMPPVEAEAKPPVMAPVSVVADATVSAQPKKKTKAPKPSAQSPPMVVKPVLLNTDTSAFAVEDIHEATPAPSGKKKAPKKKPAPAIVVATQAPSKAAEDAPKPKVAKEESKPVSAVVNEMSVEDMPPGLLLHQPGVQHQAPLSSYSMFAEDAGESVDETDLEEGNEASYEPEMTLPPFLAQSMATNLAASEIFPSAAPRIFPDNDEERRPSSFRYWATDHSQSQSCEPYMPRQHQSEYGHSRFGFRGDPRYGHPQQRYEEESFGREYNPTFGHVEYQPQPAAAQQLHHHDQRAQSRYVFPPDPRAYPEGHYQPETRYTEQAIRTRPYYADAYSGGPANPDYDLHSPTMPPGFVAPSAAPLRPSYSLREHLQREQYHQQHPAVAPGREGFTPFEDWSPIKSSLFSTPLFPKRHDGPPPPNPHHNQS